MIKSESVNYLVICSTCNSFLKDTIIFNFCILILRKCMLNLYFCYLYRAVDKWGNTVDFLLTRRTRRMSAQSFLIKAIKNNGRQR
ncbi:DDE-type integrase/transposase/recombinase [Flavobacterium procerum]